MNSNTTAPVSGANTEELSPVTVSLHKLVEGVGTVFAGVIQMLEALDAKTAAHLTGVALQNMEASEQVVADSGDVGKEEKNANKESAAATDTAVSVPSDEAKSPGQPAEEKNGQNAEQSKGPVTSSVTLDDITKIIVGKIKQNPSNNEKIHALVKAHGAERVRDLPSSKYEAFLTDLSQI